jgi:hypothetical protein
MRFGYGHILAKIREMGSVGHVRESQPPESRE